MKHPKRTKQSVESGFSLVETVLVVAVLSIIVAIAVPYVTNATAASRETKLTNEVASINRAIQIYRSNGGSLVGLTRPQEIIDKLKTVRSADSAKTYVGINGSMIDARVFCVVGDVDDNSLCAVWNDTDKQFELSRGGINVVQRFALKAPTAITQEVRADSLVEYGSKGWIWEYGEPAEKELFLIPNAGGSPTLSNVPNSLPTSQTPGLTQAIDTPTISIPEETPDNGIVIIQPCEPPTFLILGGEFPKADFPLDCPLINPNGLNAQIFYKIEGKDEEWLPYNANFTCEPGDTVVAYCKSTNQGFTDSEEVSQTYISDNQAPQCVNDNYTINIIYNSHLFAGSTHSTKYGLDNEDFDQGTYFETGNGNTKEQIYAPCDNDTDPDGDELIVCAIRAVNDQLPIECKVNDDGTVSFIPNTDPGVLGYRHTKYIDFKGNQFEDDEDNNKYDEFWKDIASVYKWRISDEGKAVGDRTDNNGNFTASDKFEYVACDTEGAQDVGTIECNVKGLTVLSPIAIDTDRSGSIELTSGNQSFDFDGNGTLETVSGWFGANDGILVDAKYGDKITGEHLFGDMAGRYSDGFAKLSLRDTNGNGSIDGAELSELKLWFDNGNAQLDQGELKSIDEFGITEISLEHSDFVSKATDRDGQKVHVEDIWFPVVKH